MKQLKIVEAKKEDIDAIISFHRMVDKTIRFSRNNILWEQWGLKGNLGVFGLLKYGDRIVGTQEFIPIYLLEGKRIILCCISERTLLSPEYRGGNDFMKFYDCLIDNVKHKGCECIYGITYAEKAFRKFGFNNMQPIKHITLVFNVVGSFKAIFCTDEKWSIKCPRFTLSLGTWMLTKIKYPILDLNFRCFKNHFKVVAQIPKESNMKELLSEFRGKYPDMIFLSFDELFLNWRVLDNPFRNYKFLTLYKDKSLLGYAIIDVTESNYELVDIGWTEEGYLDIFLWQIVSFCKHEKACSTFNFWGNYTNPLIKRIFGGLEKMGGIKYSSRVWFVHRILKDQTPNGLNSLEKWFLTPMWFPTVYDK